MVVDRRQKSEVKNLLYLLTASVLVGLLSAWAILHYYNPTGRYLAQHVLLSPEVAKKMDFLDVNPKNQRLSHFILNSIVFEYVKNGEKKKKWVDLEDYTKFYREVESYESIEDPKDSLIASFIASSTANLIVSVKTENPQAVKEFQQIQFQPEGNYFRAALRSSSSQSEWIYFYAPGIYEKVLHYFEKD